MMKVAKRILDGKERGMEEKKEKSGDKRIMILWIALVMLVIIAYSAIEIHDQWKLYDAGRAVERKEIAKRMEKKIESGRKSFDEDLGIWIIPAGRGQIKAMAPDNQKNPGPGQAHYHLAGAHD